MRLASDGTLRLSPSDLGNHLACPHLRQLERRVQRKELTRPVLKDPYGDVIRDKGKEHERAYLARLEAAGKTIARMPEYEDGDFDSEEARRLTEEAIRRRGRRHLPGLQQATQVVVQIRVLRQRHTLALAAHSDLSILTNLTTLGTRWTLSTFRPCRHSTSPARRAPSPTS